MKKMKTSNFAAAALVAGLSLGLSACADVDKDLDSAVRDESLQSVHYSASGCNPDVPKAENVNWPKADKISYTFDYESLSPMVINIDKGTPYELTITNGADDARYFTPGSFFANSYVDRLLLDGEDRTKDCVYSLRLEPQQTAVFRIVPGKTGRYEVHDSYWPLLFSDGADGVINVH